MTATGEILTRILNSYPPGIGLITALEAFVKTREDQAYGRAKDEVAKHACEGLHDGPATGLRCGSCVKAVDVAAQRNAVDGEIEAARKG